MATPLENLQTAYEQVCANLVTITASPKPTYNIDGQLVEWTEYMKMLTEQLEALTAAINAQNPYEVHHQGFT